MRVKNFKINYLNKKYVIVLLCFLLFNHIQCWSYSSINSLNNKVFKQHLCKIRSYLKGSSFIDNIQINYIQNYLNNEKIGYSLDDLVSFKIDMENIVCEQSKVTSIYKMKSEYKELQTNSIYKNCQGYINAKKEIENLKQFLLKELSNYSVLIKTYFDKCSNKLEYCYDVSENINNSILKMKELNFKINKLKEVFDSNKFIQVTDYFDIPSMSSIKNHALINNADYFIQPKKLYVSSIGETWNKEKSNDSFPFNIKISKLNNYISIRQEVTEYELCTENKNYILDGKFISHIDGEINSEDILLLSM